MEIVTMNLNDLNSAEYNPRKILAPGDVEYEKIKQSILHFGMVEPIIWNRQTDRVVGGHQRLTVLRNLGYETVEVSVIDVDEPQEKALNIALNKISGEWDEDRLTALLEELSSAADDMLFSLTGFTEEELDEMFASDEEISTSSEEEEECFTSRETNFHYQEQFGVIVLCESENEQKDVYEKLIAQGFSCRVVAT